VVFDREIWGTEHGDSRDFGVGTMCGGKRNGMWKKHTENHGFHGSGFDAKKQLETFDKMTSFSKGIFSTIFSAEYHIFPVTLDHGNRV
jgi:hypothetical protein